MKKMNCPNCNKDNPELAIKCECGFVFKGYEEASDTSKDTLKTSSSGGMGMGNIIFIILHVIGVIFGFWMLIITIPCHLIYSKINK